MHFFSLADEPMDLRVAGGLVYARRKKKLERALHQLSTSINYGGKRGRRDEGRLSRSEEP